MTAVGLDTNIRKFFKIFRDLQDLENSRYLEKRQYFRDLGAFVRL